MRKRLLLAAVCILTLPFVFSPTTGNKLNNSAAFVTVAIAGHVIGGNRYCPCNNPESCASGQSLRIDDSQPQDQDATEQNTTQNDLVAGLGVALLMLTLWLKLRA